MPDAVVAVLLFFGADVALLVAAIVIILRPTWQDVRFLWTLARLWLRS